MAEGADAPALTLTRRDLGEWASTMETIRTEWCALDRENAHLERTVRAMADAESHEAARAIAEGALRVLHSMRERAYPFAVPPPRPPGGGDGPLHAPTPA
jgi:hypothetical protein